MNQTTTASASLTEGQVAIKTETDIVLARRQVRDAAAQLGFGVTDVTRIVTAASELARNTFKYAGEGVMRWRRVERPGQAGLELQFIDRGPGIGLARSCRQGALFTIRARRQPKWARPPQANVDQGRSRRFQSALRRGTGQMTFPDGQRSKAKREAASN